MAVLERFEAKKPLRSKIYNILTLGYKDRERIREADKLVRDSIAKGCKSIGEKAGYCIDSLAKALKVDSLGEFQKIAKQCGRLSKQIEHATVGYAPRFGLVQVKKEQLRDFYNFDMGLLDDLQSLDADLAKIVSIVEGSGVAPVAAMNAVKRKLDGIEDKMQKREDIVLKILS